MIFMCNDSAQSICPFRLYPCGIMIKKGEGREEFPKNGIHKKRGVGSGRRGQTRYMEFHGYKSTLVDVSTHDSRIRLNLRWLNSWFTLWKKDMYMWYYILTSYIWTKDISNLLYYCKFRWRFQSKSFRLIGNCELNE